MDFEDLGYFSAGGGPKFTSSLQNLISVTKNTNYDRADEIVRADEQNMSHVFWFHRADDKIMPHPCFEPSNYATSLKFRHQPLQPPPP